VPVFARDLGGLFKSICAFALDSLAEIVDSLLNLATLHGNKGFEASPQLFLVFDISD
jgi:hypothetical protein